MSEVQTLKHTDLVRHSYSGTTTVNGNVVLLFVQSAAHLKQGTKTLRIATEHLQQCRTTSGIKPTPTHTTAAAAAAAAPVKGSRGHPAPWQDPR
jgi:hypothetical protein